MLGGIYGWRTSELVFFVSAVASSPGGFRGPASGIRTLRSVWLQTPHEVASGLDSLRGESPISLAAQFGRHSLPQMDWEQAPSPAFKLKTTGHFGLQRTTD